METLDLDARIAAAEAQTTTVNQSMSELLVERIQADLRTWRPEGGSLDTVIIWGDFEYPSDVTTKILDRHGNIVTPTGHTFNEGRDYARDVVYSAGIPEQVGEDLHALEEMGIEPGVITF